MTVPPAIKVLLHFLLHIVTGIILFGAVAGAAILLSYVAQWIATVGVPYEISLGCYLVTDLLFWLDVLCFVFFIGVEVWKLLREIAAGLKGAEAK